MAQVTLDEVVISDFGGRNPRRLPVANCQCSWAINEPGSFSAFARVADLRAAGLAGDLRGKWLTWAHPQAGAWGGLVTGRPVTAGVAEVAAEGWAALLRGRVLAEWERPVPGSAGGLARRVVAGAGSDAPLFLEIGAIDEGGPAVTVAFGGADMLDDVLPALVEAGGLEWTVDAARRFHAARRLGRDRSPAVRLVEDRHVVDYRIADDLWAAAGADAVWAVESPEDTARRLAAQAAAGGDAAAAAGIRAGDPRVRLLAAAAGGVGLPAWGGVVYAGFGGAAAAPAPPGTALGERLPWGGGRPSWQGQRPGVGSNHPGVPSGHALPAPTVPAELTLANADRVWTRFGLGDTVRLELGSAGFSGWFRVRGLALDAAAGELTAVGEALAG